MTTPDNPDSLGSPEYLPPLGTQENRKLLFAYADPPYVGCSKLYGHPDSARWDDPAEHVQLMHQIDADFDGWALSASVPSLAQLLPDAPAGTRVAAWVKPFAAYKRNVRVAYTWEPVLWKRTTDRRPGEPVGRDHLSANITLRRGTVGAKPEAFAAWLRVLFGWIEGDQLVDLFPGSGAIGKSFERWRLPLDWPLCACGAMPVAPGTRTEVRSVSHGEMPCYLIDLDRGETQ